MTRDYYQLRLSPMRKYIIFISVILILLASCSHTDSHSVIIWTNRPEIAAYIEEFNASHNKIKVEVEYKQNPGKELKTSTSLPDMIFDEYINTEGFLPLFTSLDAVFNEHGIDRKLFYQNLLKQGVLNKNQVILPVSFNLPLIFFNKTHTSKYIVPFFMNLSNLKNASIAANKQTTKKFITRGFSPLWNTETPFQTAILFHTDFHQMNGFLNWNNENVMKSITYMKDWIKTVNGGLIQEKDFIDKFLYDPKPKLITENRIAFSYSNLNDYFAIPPEKRNSLDFRWFSTDNKVQSLHSILFTGIPKGASHKKDAETFLIWFFNMSTQKTFLESTKHKRIRIFGLAEGFSSLKEINSNELPRFYPGLMGHIPPESSIIFPPAVPENWVQVKEKVIKPWFFEQISQTNPPVTTLKEAIKEWEKQNPERVLSN